MHDGISSHRTLLDSYSYSYFANEETEFLREKELAYGYAAREGSEPRSGPGLARS